MSALITESVEVAGERFYYLAIEEARKDPDRPLVLCLHGFPDHPPSFIPVMERLAAAGFRPVAPWMRGYYPSVQGGPYHAERLAGDVIGLAHALSPDRRAFLLGHDWGAAATYAAMAEAPEQFCAAITLAVPHPLTFMANLGLQPGQLYRSWYMLFFQLPHLPERIVRRRGLAFIDRLWRTWSPGYRLGSSARQKLHDCLEASWPAPLEYYRALLQPVGAAISRIRDQARRRIVTPTLHLHGADDGCIAFSAGHGQERYFTGPFESQIIPNAGHFVQLEAPDTVAARAIAWARRWDHQRP